MAGWIGTILRVNLTEGTIKKEALDMEAAKKFAVERYVMFNLKTDNINKIRTFICPYLPILFLNFLYFFIIFIQNI